MKTALTTTVLAAVLPAIGGLTLSAQQPAQSTATPRAVAPADLTGYWTAVITEDWRFRMVTPPKGDAPGIPLNDAGLKAAGATQRRPRRQAR